MREPHPGTTEQGTQEVQIEEGMPRGIQDPKEKVNSRGIVGEGGVVE